jgi:hypothetical protein
MVIALLAVRGGLLPRTAGYLRVVVVEDLS